MLEVGRNKDDGNEGWTVDYITQVGRDILGDDASVYAETTSLIPGANRGSSNGSNGGNQRQINNDEEISPFIFSGDFLLFLQAIFQ